MAKSPDAFRTISEVADWLGVEAHVLRFWETKFTQVKPVKRAGGRRYYRPADMALLGGIRRLLHEDGLTIRGVQKILREKGVSHVSTLSPALRLDGSGAPAAGPDAAIAAATPVEDGVPHIPTRAPHDDAPTLPFNLSDARPPSHADHASADGIPMEETSAPPTEGDGRLPPDTAADDAVARPAAATSADEDFETPIAAMVLSAVLRRSARPPFDPDAAAPLVERARQLAERLRSVPE